jgi:NAD(P)-dependent dehydrogenase (short-subunit alcohol dehydrogenase family)
MSQPETSADGRSHEAVRPNMAFAIDPELFGLLDTVALVTGGGAGIGRASAIQLARAGCHVAVADIDEPAARATADEIEALGRRSTVIVADVRDAREVTAMVTTARQRLGPLTAAVNVVGGPGGTILPFLDMTVAQLDAVMELNFTSAFLCCQAEVVAMVEDATKGRIVNVASSSGVVGAPNISGYGAANAAIIHFTKSAAMEVARYGVRINCVIPGTQARATAPEPDEKPGMREFRERAAAAPPLGRLGDPMETAGVALFLASDLSSYLTGHGVFSDGGVVHTTARPPVGMTLTAAALGGRG